MEISVVIPVDGRSGYLARSLETIMAQPSLRSSLHAEIIVVDNARTTEERQATHDVCVEATQRHRGAGAVLRYIATQHANPRHRNVSYPRNVGIRLATAPLILMTDADILHVSETLVQHVTRHREFAKLLLYSFCRDCDANLLLEHASLQSALHDSRFALRMAASTDWFGGMCCSVKREDAIGVGGFEESFTRWGYEDYDFARRLQARGVGVIRDDDIQVLHQVHPPRTQGKWMMKAYAGMRQLMHVMTANRDRAWGQTTGAAETIAVNAAGDIDGDESDEKEGRGLPT